MYIMNDLTFNDMTLILSVYMNAIMSLVETHMTCI
jgi:hypothetical protein